MMSRRWLTIFLAGFLIFLLAGCKASSKQQPAPTADPFARDAAFEAQIQEELRAIDPQAADLFASSTQALDAGDIATAKAGYEQVLQLAPSFSHALRRLSGAEMNLKEYDLAEEHARQALALDAADYNQAQLALVLLNKGGVDANAEALRLANQAAQSNPEDATNELVLMWAGIMTENEVAMRQGSDYLIKAVPELPEAHFIAGLIAAQQGRWEKAESELLKARSLGVNADVIEEALADGVRAKASQTRWARAGLYIFGGWLGSMLVLFLLGVVLSAVTMAAVRRPSAHPDARPGWLERGVRGVYRLVIGLASLYFYISLPMLIILTLAVVGGIIYLFFRIGRIPIQITVMLVVGGSISILAIVRSLFVLNKDRDPGRPLPQEEAPDLWALTAEVARKLTTRPVQAIYITPGTEIAVTERGGVVRKLSGRGQRCLIIGLGALQGLDQGQLRGILAHEYGHFSNRDTAGGGLAHQVLRSMQKMGHDLVAEGQAKFWNPAWLFVNTYIRLFIRIAHGASRLQEVLADRYAALAYGPGNFIDSLQQVVRQTVIFNYRLNESVKSWAANPVVPPSEISPEQREKMGNAGAPVFRMPELSAVYHAAPPQAGETELEQSIQKAFDQKTSVYDTHLSLRERVQLCQALPGMLSEIDRRPAWDLLPDAEALQAEMQNQLALNIIGSLGGHIPIPMETPKEPGVEVPPEAT